MSNVTGDICEEEYSSELKELRENAKNLSECQHTLLRRIDELEKRRTAEFVANAVINRPWLYKCAHLAVENDQNGQQVKVECSEKVDSDDRRQTTKKTHVYRSLAFPEDYYRTSPFWEKSDMPSQYSNDNPVLTPCIVGFRAKKGSIGEHLGLVLHEQDGQLVVDSIDDASPLAKQGIIHSGDSILELNGHEVNSMDQFIKQLKQAGEAISLKVVPSRVHEPPIQSVYCRTSFDYEPFKDDQVPCKSIGLAFKNGDILQVINKDDPNWWQARKMNDLSRIGLIPSESLEEKRRSATNGKNKEKLKNTIGALVGSPYEQIGFLSPYGRRVMILLGATGVGRRKIKSMLLAHDPVNFATVVPYTSRARRPNEQEGREYRFVDRNRLQKDIDHDQLVEWGEYGGAIYGTTMQSVRTIVTSGRMCVLDSAPQAVPRLYNREFMPYVVFLSPPSLDEFKQLHQLHPSRSGDKTEDDLKCTCDESTRIEEQCHHLFDLMLVNRNIDVTFRRLLDSLNAIKNQAQWIPLSWLH